MVTATQPTPATLGRRVSGHIRLADPVTWISPSLVCVCGAIASGQAGWNGSDIARAALGALLVGPLATGFSQSINDYYDRELDAINDPARPIPAGDVTLAEARWNWIALAAAAALLGLAFGPQIFVLTLVGLFVSAIYSVPPIKLKKNVWLSAPAVGMGYVAMSWLAGHLLFAPLTWPSVVVALINGLIGTGLLFLNDLKSIEGDRQHGLRSLTVTLGVRPTLLVAFGLVNAAQLALLALALRWGHLYVALLVLVAIVVPIYQQLRMYQAPNHTNFVRYMIASNPFVALIQVVSAFVVGGYFS
jgi:chlorophyll/bacteriochlorophyll a synthase